MSDSLSQVTVIGRPQPKSWADYRQGCLDNYGGGHHSDGHLEAFQHGMETVFNLLEAEFPPAEQCKAATDLLTACKSALDAIAEEKMLQARRGESVHYFLGTAESFLRPAIAKATSGNKSLDSQAAVR